LAPVTPDFTRRDVRDWRRARIVRSYQHVGS
jgi:hypothetical protein